MRTSIVFVLLPDDRGVLLEHFIAYELQRRLGELWPDAALYHYRTRHGAEVDFVVQTGRDLWAIEVKSSTTVGARDVTGLNAMADRVARVRRKSIVFLGPRRRLLGDVEALPLDRFLDELPS